MEDFLKQALRLAQIRRGFCAPNPSVGAVIVKNGEVLSEGFHFQAGAPHAEAEALRSLDERAQGATAVVTLEPCSHFGRTPPCAELLVQRGIREVIFGFSDPNPLVAGKGVAALKAAGVSVTHLPSEEVDAFYESYAHWVQTGRPFVTLKLALSLDGKIAGPGGQREKISGEELDLFTHKARKESDALLTTVKTLNQDNPQLNVRLSQETLSKPVYVLDSELRLRENLQIQSTAEKLIVFCSEKASAEKRAFWEARGVEVRAVKTQTQGLDLEEVLLSIGRDGKHDLFVEAGGRCFQSFWEANLVGKAYLYIGPRWLGQKAWPAFSELPKSLQNARFSWKGVGGDALAEVRP